ncbi:MAG: LytTR family DNA-binding domain-containing protein [Flavobacteriales bacterium]|nr:LytTR family DNA-binding domain-containing protein [Flavobacteriales bacterium]
MKRYRTIIVDDEINGAKTLKALVEVCCPQLDVIALSHTPEEAISLIMNLQPDLVFLDIEMPEMSGFEMLEKLGRFSFDVIFVTAYAEFALKAFKTNAISYLLKPIDGDELTVAYDKFLVKSDHKLEQRLTRLENLFFEMRTSRGFHRLPVATSDGIIFLETARIVRMEADSNYTHIFLDGGKKITSSKTMKDYEDILPAEEFYRIHHGHIVNIRYVERYIRGEGGYVVTTDQTTLEVSRRKKADLLTLLNNLK